MLISAIFNSQCNETVRSCTLVYPTADSGLGLTITYQQENESVSRALKLRPSSADSLSLIILRLYLLLPLACFTK